MVCVIMFDSTYHILFGGDNKMPSDITFSKSMSIAPKQFDSIKPNIQITVKNVPMRYLAEVRQCMNDIMDEFFDLEVLSQYTTYSAIQNQGLDNYCNNIVDNIDEISEKIEKQFKKLRSYMDVEKF